MFTKVALVTAASTFGLSGLLGLATAHPLQAVRQPVRARSSDNLVLQPQTHWNGIGSNPNAQLLDEDNFYWESNGVVGNFTASGGSSRKVMNVHRLGNYLTAIDCSNPGKIVLTFKDGGALSATQSEWEWLDRDLSNSILLVADGGNCGGQNGRAPYDITHVDYDQSSLKATLSGYAGKWTDFVSDDFNLNIKTGAPDPSGKSKRFKHTFDVSHDFSKNLFSKNVGGVDVKVDCSGCATTGSIDLNLDFGFTGVSGSIAAANGLGASLGLGITASGKLTSAADSGSIDLLNVALTGIQIPGLGEIGPDLTVAAQASLTAVSAQATANFGVAMTIPDGTTLRIGGNSDLINPSFNKIGPTISSSVSVSGNVSPIITIQIAATILKHGLLAGVGLLAPQLDATLTASASSSGGVCGVSNALAGVELDVNAGVTVNLFGGFGKLGDQPNAVKVFSASTPVFHDCITITTGTPDVPANATVLANEGFNGNDGKRRFAGVVTYANNDKVNFFNDGAEADYSPIQPESDGTGIQSISLDGNVGYSECFLASVFIDHESCSGDHIGSVPAGGSFDVPSNLAKNVLCILCANKQ